MYIYKKININNYVSFQVHFYMPYQYHVKYYWQRISKSTPTAYFSKNLKKQTTTSISNFPTNSPTSSPNFPSIHQPKIIKTTPYY